jgi:hypothetical protein
MAPSEAAYTSAHLEMAAQRAEKDLNSLNKASFAAPGD